MVLPKARLWRGTARLEHRLRNSQAAMTAMLDWPQRYTRRFVDEFSNRDVEVNALCERVVVSYYSGIGTPEFALRCLEELLLWCRHGGLSW